MPAQRAALPRAGALRGRGRGAQGCWERLGGQPLAFSWQDLSWRLRATLALSGCWEAQDPIAPRNCPPSWTLHAPGFRRGSSASAISLDCPSTSIPQPLGQQALAGFGSSHHHSPSTAPAQQPLAPLPVFHEKLGQTLQK